jgi:ubiquinone biosynthesis monooxygenase Coq6
LGLADSKCLSSVILSGIETGQDIGSSLILSEYSSSRYPQNLLMLGACDVIGKVFKSENHIISWGRSVGLDVLNQVKPIKDVLQKFAS